MASYPRLSRRIQAVLIDGIIIPVAVIGSLLLLSSVGVDGLYSALIGGLVFFILEPLLVSWKGGTLGHQILGMEVKNRKTGSRLNIVSAVIRVFIKLPLGLLSFFSVLFTRHYQAIHDLSVGSIVVIRNPDLMPKSDVLGERDVEDSNYAYPSIVRRLLIIVVYSFLLTFISSLLVTTLVSELCFTHQQCTNVDRAVVVVVQLFWLIGLASTVVFGWKAKMFGARKRLKQQDDMDD